MLFLDRHDAGRQLARKLKSYKDENPVIYALPRGGIPVGYEIARTLDAPLEVLISRKIGSPHQPEFGIGAIAEGGIETIDEEMLRVLNLGEKGLRDLIEKEEKELKRRVRVYRAGRTFLDPENRTVILVDDGLATGVTARAAIFSLARFRPKKIIFSAPVCASDTVRELRQFVENVVCISSPIEFGAVGGWYQNFEQLEDRDILPLIKEIIEIRKKEGNDDVMNAPFI